MKLSGWTDAPSGGNARIKLQNGQACRVCILDDSPEMVKSHYIKGSGYYLCLGDGCPLCSVNEWRMRFATYVFLYNQDAQGNPVKDAEGKVSGSIIAWTFSHDKMSMLTQIAQTYAAFGPLKNYDIVLTCIEETFQRYYIMPDVSSGAPLWQQDAALKAKVEADYNSLNKDLSAKCGKRADHQEAMMLISRTGAPGAVPGMMQPGFGSQAQPQFGFGAQAQPGLGGPQFASPQGVQTSPQQPPQPPQQPFQPPAAAVPPQPPAQPVQAPAAPQAVPPQQLPQQPPQPPQQPLPQPGQVQPSPAPLPPANQEEAKARIDSLINLPSPPQPPASS